jgi:hypothetical protein
MTPESIISRYKTSSQDDEEGPSDFKQCIEYLDKHLTKFPKKNAWWDPPNNLAINSALMGLNLWCFSILPNFAGSAATYRPKTDRLPEGIVIDPRWVPAPRSLGGNETYPHTAKVAEILVRQVSKVNDVQYMVKYQLDWIEKEYKIQIPSSVQSSLVGDALKVATRKWGVNGLRQKRILIPFDGSKSIQLGGWD